MKQYICVMVLVGLALGLTGCSSAPSKSELAQMTEAVESLDALLTEIEEGPQESTIHRIHIEPQVFEDQGVSVMLVGVEEIVEIPSFFPVRPPEGHRFVVFEFEFVNGNKGDFIVSSLLNFIARAGGEEKIVSTAALVALEREYTQLDFVLAPGKSMRGQIGFELPVSGAVAIEYRHGCVYTKSDNTEAAELTSYTFTYER